MPTFAIFVEFLQKAFFLENCGTESIPEELVVMLNIVLGVVIGY